MLRTWKWMWEQPMCVKSRRPQVVAECIKQLNSQPSSRVMYWYNFAMSNHSTQMFQIITFPKHILCTLKPLMYLSNCVGQYKVDLLQTSDLDNRLDHFDGVIKNLYYLQIWWKFSTFTVIFKVYFLLFSWNYLTFHFIKVS